MERILKIGGVTTLIYAFAFAVRAAWILYDIRDCTDDTCPFLITEPFIAIALFIVGGILLSLTRIRNVGKVATIVAILVLFLATYIAYLFLSAFLFDLRNWSYSEGRGSHINSK